MLVRILRKLDEYLKVPSVVGFEKPFLDYLAQDFRELGLNVVRADNIVVVSGDLPSSTYLSAHVDRHGIVSLGDGQYSYAAHAVKNYQYREDTTISRPDYIDNIKSQFVGEKVYAYGRWSGKNLGEGVVSDCRFNADIIDKPQLIFSIDGLPDFPESIPVAYHPHPVYDGKYIGGQTDNTLCIAIIYWLFAAGFQGTAFFTAEEEIGKSWKHLSAYLNQIKLKTDRLLILDTSPFESAKEADEGLVVLRNRDSLGQFNPNMVALLKAVCEEQETPFIVKDEMLLAQGKTEQQLGRTELGRLIMEYHGKWSGATLQIPTFNYHTNYESTTPLAVQNFLLVLGQYLSQQNITLFDFAENA